MAGLSCIIPTLNAAEYLPQCLGSLRQVFGNIEIIIADGASSDGTRSIARDFAARVVACGRGRGLQCNEGAKAASGDILLFIHADSLISPEALKVITAALQDEKMIMAKFLMHFDHKHWLLDISSLMARFDSFWTSFGDQGIIIRRSFFDELGGFRNWPLFEDVDLFARARKMTTIRTLPVKIITSAAKFKKRGVIKQQLKNGWLIVQYQCGVSPWKLYEKYYS